MSRCRTQTGFSLVELLVSIAIIVILLALVISAVQMVRVAVGQVQCLNRMRQFGSACHGYAEDNGRKLPSYLPTWKDSPAMIESPFVSTLPYVEHGSYYREVMDGSRSPGNDFAMRHLLCPVDPTINHGGAALSSFAANYRVFGRKSELPATFRDGVSNTVLLSHHYAHPYTGGPGGIHYTQFDWFEVLNLPPGQTVPGVVVRLRRATFADKEAGDVYPETSSGRPPRTLASIRGLTFQARPAIEQCDPRIPNSPHSGLPVVMADGSSRLLKRNISEEVFWSLVTPAGGEVFDQDW